MKNKNMHYIDMGSGFPLLLGHSYLFDANMWSLQLQALVKSYRVIIPDLWGHGSSPELPDSCCSLSDIAHDHLNLMDDLGIKEFGIVGMSVGGMWGGELAALYPQRVKLIVLMGTFLGAEPDVQRQRYFALLNDANQSGAINSPVLEYIARQFYSDDVSTELLLPLMENLKSLPAERIRQSIVPLGKMIFGRTDKLPLLEKIKVPSLIVTGEFDKPRPPSEGALMARLLRCEHVVISGAGHISAVEKAETVTQVLLQFLKQNVESVAP